MAKSKNQITRLLLICGILSSLFYVILNIVTVTFYKGYSPVTQTVSELSAIGAPTRSLWVSLVNIYSVLVILFGIGVWRSGMENKYLRITGLLLIVDSLIGFFWPPMHQREVLAAGGATSSDTMHIFFTAVTVLLMMLIIGFAAAALKRWFAFYSLITLSILITAGILTGIESPNIEKNLSTPLIGIWERINIGIYMLWLAVFAIVLLRRKKDQPAQEKYIKAVDRKRTKKAVADIELQ